MVDLFESQWPFSFGFGIGWVKEGALGLESLGLVAVVVDGSSTGCVAARSAHWNAEEPIELPSRAGVVRDEGGEV